MSNNFVSVDAEALNCYCLWCLQNISLFFSLVTCLCISGIEGSYSTFLLWQPNQKPFAFFLQDNEQHCSGNNIDRMCVDLLYLMHWERDCLSQYFPKQLCGLLCCAVTKQYSALFFCAHAHVFGTEDLDVVWCSAFFDSYRAN